MREDTDLSRSVRRAIESYIRDLDGERPGDVHAMVMRCVERPLIEAVLAHVQGNQSHAADMLGINRNTLRKKMQSLRIKP